MADDEIRLDAITEDLFTSGIRWKFFLRLIGIKEELIMNICDSYVYEKDQEKCLKALNEHCQELEDEELGIFHRTLKQKLNALMKGKRRLRKKRMSINASTSKLAMEKCTAKSLQIIANNVGPYWKILGRKLNCSLSEIECENADYNNSVEKAFQCLYMANKNDIDLQLGSILSIIRNEEKIPQRIYRNCVGDLKKHVYPSEKSFMERDNQQHYIRIIWEDVAMITHTSLTEHRELEEQVQCYENMKSQTQSIIGVTVHYETYSNRMKKSDLVTKSLNYLSRNPHKLYFSSYTDEETTNFSAFCKFIENGSQGYVLHGYNIMNHFEFLGFEMCITDYHFLESQSSHAMDYIGVRAEDKTIYFIKMSKSTSLEELKKDIDESAAFVRMFVLLHKDYFSDEIQCILSLIVIPDASKYLIGGLSNICKHCRDFVITETQFENFDIQLQSNFHKLIRENIQNIEIEKKTRQKFDKFEYAIASIIGFIKKEVIIQSQRARNENKGLRTFAKSIPINSLPTSLDTRGKKIACVLGCWCILVYCCWCVFSIW